MYSTERGNFGYYTQSHIYRYCIFFLIFISLSFVRIQLWHKFAYLFYFIVLILIIGVDLFGVTASGSKRWINLFVINLQPSELMKVALISFLARYYYKIPSHDFHKIGNLIIPTFCFIYSCWFSSCAARSRNSVTYRNWRSGCSLASWF